MVDEPEAQRLDVSEEDEGGPVKSFLEHLEDLRWVLIKSLTAAGVAILGCLLAGNYVVGVLEWPLKRAPVWHRGSTHQSVRVTFGTNQLTVLHLNAATNSAWAALVGTNPSVRLDIAPVVNSTNRSGYG